MSPKRWLVARHGLAVATLLAVLACLSPSLPAATPSGAEALLDDEGNTVALAMPAARIVSLSPGATAMLFAAGAGSHVVGTSAYSDEPAAAQAIERVGDAQSLDLERILALAPDVVVVWGGGTSQAQLARLERVGLRLYRHRVTRLDDLAASLVRFGRLAGTEATAQASAAALTQRIERLRRRYASPDGASVLIQVWDHPIYTVGGAELMSDVVQACGLHNVFADLNQAGPAVTLESVLARDPQVILALAPDRSSARSWLAAWQHYGSLQAVRNARLISWTDERLSRLGPSVVDAAEDLCRVLRP